MNWHVPLMRSSWETKIKHTSIILFRSFPTQTSANQTRCSIPFRSKPLIESRPINLPRRGLENARDRFTWKDEARKAFPEAFADEQSLASPQLPAVSLFSKIRLIDK